MLVVQLTAHSVYIIFSQKNSIKDCLCRGATLDNIMQLRLDAESYCQTHPRSFKSKDKLINCSNVAAKVLASSNHML